MTAVFAQQRMRDASILVGVTYGGLKFPVARQHFLVAVGPTTSCRAEIVVRKNGKIEQEQTEGTETTNGEK